MKLGEGSLGTTCILHLGTAAVVILLKGWGPWSFGGLSLSCLLTAEAFVGSDGQNLHVDLLHVASWPPDKTEAGSQDGHVGTGSLLEEIFVAFYELTWRSQGVPSAAFCSSRKSQNSGQFCGELKDFLGVCGVRESSKVLEGPMDLEVCRGHLFQNPM